jgi:hypothetical protein
MLRFAADENFNNDILRGLRRSDEGVDVVRVQDVGLSSSHDPIILDWAARESRGVLSRYVATLVRFAGGSRTAASAAGAPGTIAPASPASARRCRGRRCKRGLRARSSSRCGRGERGGECGEVAKQVGLAEVGAGRTARVVGSTARRWAVVAASTAIGGEAAGCQSTGRTRANRLLQATIPVRQGTT